MRTLRRALLAPTVMLAALFAIPATSQATSPGWVLQCALAKSLPDDPIVHPGMSGMSHLHDFFGNTSINAASTYQSMRAGRTTCPVGDTAGYWAPALYKNGVKVDPRGFRRDGRPTRNTFYYRADNVSSSYKASHPVEAFPADFRMIAGTSRATSEAAQPKLGREIYWGCSDNSTGKLKAPPNCSTGTISLHVGFPNCWNGLKDPRNDTPNVVYPSSYACPPTHPRVLPRVIFRLEYPVGTSSAGITLSSGPYYTIHGDFWNTWDQAKLRTLVDSCLNAGKDCGTFVGQGGGGTTPSSTSTRGMSTMDGAATTRRASGTVPHGSTTDAAPSTQVPTTSKRLARATFSSAAGLPSTGARTSTLVVLAVGLSCVGAAALIITRRRGKHQRGRRSSPVS